MQLRALESETMAPTDPITCDIAIAGGSHAGLGLALALAKTLGPELRITIIERRARDAAITPEPRAFALSAGSRGLLTALGVWPSLADRATPVTRIEITDSGLEHALRPTLLVYDNRVPASGEAATHIVEADHLRTALHEAVVRQPGISWIAPAGVASLAPGPANIDIGLDDGRTIAAGLLVASDGARSRVRDLAAIKTVGWSYGQTGIVTVVAHARPHDGVAVQHFLPAGPFAMLPLRGNRSCITWSEGAANATRILALDDAAFLAEVERRFGHRLGALSLGGSRASWPLELQLARSLIAPRVALVGDAARSVHPIAGQGLNLGFRDVAALTEAVAGSMRVGLDPSDASGLERYERWRRFDGQASAAAFDALNRLFSRDGLAVRTARDAGLGLVDRLPGLKQLLVAEAAGLTGDVPRLLRGVVP